MFGKWLGKMGDPAIRLLREVRALSQREAGFLVAEMAQFRGLVPLLSRSGEQQRWNAADTALLHGHLRRMSSLSPYLLLAILPGSIVALPLLALWRDRRRSRRLASAGARP